MMQNVITPFHNAICHMPDLGDDNNVMILFRDLLGKIESLVDVVVVSQNDWTQQWRVFFESLATSRPDAMPVGTCMVCMDDTPTVNVCNNVQSQHNVCPECLLSHYWVNTDQCLKSTAQCPACRAEITLRGIVERINSLPSKPSSSASSSSSSLITSASTAMDCDFDAAIKESLWTHYSEQETRKASCVVGDSKNSEDMNMEEMKHEEVE
jgi:hypothetical protein